MNDEHKYTIKAVAMRTGLSAHVIRAWEKRYGVITPKRTETNRRLYTEQEVQRLELLRAANQAGHSIGSIAHLSDQDLKELVKLTPSAGQAEDFSDGQKLLSNSERLEACIDAISSFDAQSLDKILMSSSIKVSQPQLLNEIIIPLIQKIGDLWREGTLRVAHEHLASSVIRTFLGNMRATYEIPETAPRMIVTTPSGQLHELGALIVAVISASEGWQVTYLGPNLPVDEMVAAVEKNRARVLALSLVYPVGDPRLIQDLAKLGVNLPKDTQVVAGGRASAAYDSVLKQIGAKIMTDLHEFRRELESFILQTKVR